MRKKVLFVPLILGSVCLSTNAFAERYQQDQAYQSVNEDISYENRNAEYIAYQGRNAEDRAYQNRNARAIAYRNRNARDQYYQNDNPQDHDYQNVSVQDQNYKIKSPQGQSPQGQSLQGQNLQGQNLQGQNLQGQNLQARHYPSRNTRVIAYQNNDPADKVYGNSETIDKAYPNSDKVDKEYQANNELDTYYEGKLYFGISGGYSMANNSTILTQSVNATASGKKLIYSETAPVSSLPFSGSTNETIGLSSKVSKSFVSLEGGYNFNKYFGLGVELSRRSIDLSTLTSSSYHDDNTSTKNSGAIIKGHHLSGGKTAPATPVATNVTTNVFTEDFPYSLSVYSGLIKTTGYFPINKTFAVYGDLGLGISEMWAKFDHGDSYKKSDYINDMVGTASIGAGVKITPVSYMYLKIGVNFIAMNNLIDLNKYDTYLADSYKSKLDINTKDVTYNYNTKNTNTKNVYIKEVKATVGVQF